MKRTDLPPIVRRVLDKSIYATIATTCPDGQPWNTPVFARFDENLNLYWVSWRQAQHSRNIALEPRVFVVAYDSTVPEGEGLGVYMKMKARLLVTETDVRTAKKVYSTSFFKHDFARHPQFLHDCPQGFYKAQIERLWYNIDGTDRQHFIDTRREVLG